MRPAEVTSPPPPRVVPEAFEVTGTGETRRDGESSRVWFDYEWLVANVGRWAYPRHVAVKERVGLR